jgi:hypothetical protein
MTATMNAAATAQKWTSNGKGYDFWASILQWFAITDKSTRLRFAAIPPIQGDGKDGPHDTTLDSPGNKPE